MIFWRWNNLVVNASREPVVLHIEVQMTKAQVCSCWCWERLRLWTWIQSCKIRRQTSNYCSGSRSSAQAGWNQTQANTTVGLSVAGEIENIVGPNAFTLDEISWLVQRFAGVGCESKDKKHSDQDDVSMSLWPVLRSFVVADIERDYDLTWDLNLHGSGLQEQAQCSSSVYPSAVPPSKIAGIGDCNHIGEFSSDPNTCASWAARRLHKTEVERGLINRLDLIADKIELEFFEMSGFQKNINFKTRLFFSLQPLLQHRGGD